MISSIRALFLLMLFASSHLLGQVHVIMTTAQLPIRVEERTAEYLKSFWTIKSYGFEPWIIEATNTSSSLFDPIARHVLYPQRHNDSLKNKGVNETMSMRASLPYLPFEDDDIVIKLTGRYYLYSRDFIDFVEENASEYDAFVCYGKGFVSDNHVFTGCFACRWKYFKQYINEMDFDKAERDYIPVEQLFAEFIEEKKLRVKVVHPLHVIAKIYFNPDWWNVYEW